MKISDITECKGTILLEEVGYASLPFDIVIEKKLIDSGEEVNYGTPIFKIDENCLSSTFDQYNDNYIKCLNDIYTLCQNYYNEKNRKLIIENNIRIIEMELEVLDKDYEDKLNEYKITEEIGFESQKNILKLKNDAEILKIRRDIKFLEIQNSSLSTFNVNEVSLLQELDLSDDCIFNLQYEYLNDKLDYYKKILLQLKTLCDKPYLLSKHLGIIEFTENLKKTSYPTQVAHDNRIYTVYADDYYVEGIIEDIHFPFISNGDIFSIKVNAYDYKKYGFLIAKIVALENIPVNISNRQYYKYTARIIKQDDLFDLEYGLTTINCHELTKKITVLKYIYNKLYE